MTTATSTRDASANLRRNGANDELSLDSVSRSLLAAIAALAGVLFFFVIIGVFGLPASIAGLVIFVALSLTIFRRPLDGRCNDEP